MLHLKSKMVWCPCFRAAGLTTRCQEGNGERSGTNTFSVNPEGPERKLPFGKGEARGTEKNIHVNWKGFRVKCYL